ncbi:hypothetical protein Esti_005643 [Eimeria stiedai]
MGTPPTLVWLRKLSKDTFRASAAKGRMGTLSKNALRQQETIDHFIEVVSERCAPLFEVLGDLSVGLRDDCVHTFPVLNKALEELTQSALEVARMLEELNLTKQSRVAENARLSHMLAELGTVLTERKAELIKLEENISSLRASTEEKRSGSAYMDSTSRPIEELAAQRRETCAVLEKDKIAGEAANAELSASVARMRDSHEVWKDEQKRLLEQLQRNHARLLGEIKLIDEQIGDLAKCTAGLVELKHKDEAALCLLRAQIDSQGFCLDLLVSRAATTEEETKEIRKRLLFSAKQKHESEEGIDASKRMLPSLLAFVCIISHCSSSIPRRIEEAEHKHAASLSHANAFKKKALAVQFASAAAQSRVELVQTKLARIAETAHERVNYTDLEKMNRDARRCVQENQILMFAEEMQIYHQPGLAANAVALTATRTTVERLNSLRMTLSSTQRIEEETKFKCCKLEADCAAIQQDIEELRHSLESRDESNQRQARELIHKLGSEKNQISVQIEALRDEVATAQATLAEKEAFERAPVAPHQMDNMRNQETAHCLAEEQAKWDACFAELNHLNSASRRAIAEEELKICNDNFRQQVKAMRAQQEKEIDALQSHLLTLREEKDQQGKRIEELAKDSRVDAMSTQQIDSTSTSNRKSFSARKKIHARRLLGSWDANGTSLSTPHLHALREKLIMSSQSSTRTRHGAGEAPEYCHHRLCDTEGSSPCPKMLAGSSWRSGLQKHRRLVGGAAEILALTFLLNKHQARIPAARWNEPL